MSLPYIFIIVIVLIAVISFIVKVVLNRKNKKTSTKTTENSDYPSDYPTVDDNHYFTNQNNETIDYITRIDSQKFKIVMLPSEKPTAITIQNTSGNTNRAKNNRSKIEVKPNTLDFHLSEKPEQLHQLLLSHPEVEILKKEILKDKESLFNLDNLILLIIRTLNIKLKSNNDTISYPLLILEVKHYLERGNLLLENLSKATSPQLSFKNQP